MDAINNYDLINENLKVGEMSEKDKENLDQEIKRFIATGLHYGYSQHIFGWDEATFKKQFKIANEVKPPYYIDIKNAEQIYKQIFSSNTVFINDQLSLRQKYLIDGGVKRIAWEKENKILDSKYISEISFFPGQKNSGRLDIYVYNTILNKEYKFDTINFFTGFQIYS